MLTKAFNSRLYCNEAWPCIHLTHALIPVKPALAFALVCTLHRPLLQLSHSLGYFLSFMLNTDDCYPPILIYPFEEGRRVLFLVVPFPAGGLPPLGCLLARTLVLGPCFFFSPFLGRFLYIKFGRVSSFQGDYKRRSQILQQNMVFPGE
jgi:hypothetical protein